MTTDPRTSAAPKTAPAPGDSAAARPAPRRRSVVRAAAAGAVLAPVAAVLPAAAPRAEAAGGSDGPAFLHGVASGDPLPDGVLLWTRVTPVPQAVPGSGTGPDTVVGWEVAEDRDFTSVVAHGTVTARAASDHTVKADVRGLQPAHDYYYRFTVTAAAPAATAVAAVAAVSPVGRTRTAPAPGAAVDALRFGVVSCANWEAGHFSAYRHLAARTDLDAVLHLGDYLYEYASGAYCAGGTVVRPHQPPHEIITLADYRTRHGAHKTDPDVMAVQAAHPLIAIWDDHEFADNTWSGGATNHTPGDEGSWADRRAAASRAYFEWMPVRPSVAGTVHRRLSFGSLADLHLLDLRSFRSEQATIGDGDVDSPDRTLTGRAQLDWLKSGLAASSASWQLVGTSVMISPFAFGALPAEVLGPLTEMLGLPGGGLAINTDQWDGYTHDREELIAHLRDQGIDNTVFLSGDIHMAWANNVPADAATYPLTPSVATEFVVTSVTSDNINDYLHVPEGTVSVAAEAAVLATNRHVKWVDMDRHGYGVLDVTAERTQMDYYVLSDRLDPAATSSWARSYRTLSGTHRVERATDPVR